MLYFFFLADVLIDKFLKKNKQTLISLCPSIPNLTFGFQSLNTCVHYVLHAPFN